MSSALIITGMHRSGTSLTAALLQSAGLHIGTNLMAAGTGNIKGHFENLDFFRFHEKVLQSQAIDQAGWTLQPQIPVEVDFVKLAKQLILENAVSPYWGWKDPRTTLFLKFWADLLPEANFLLVYRAPWEVVDSLYRRSSRAEQIFFQQPDLAIKIWAHYNQRILKFFEGAPDRCLLVNIQTLIKHPQDWIAALNQQFQLQLTSPDPQIYETALLQQQPPNTKYPSLLQTHYPEGLALYEQLEQLSWQPEKPSEPSSPSFAWKPSMSSLQARECAFQNWLDWRRAEKECQSLKTQLQPAQPPAENTSDTATNAN